MIQSHPLELCAAHNLGLDICSWRESMQGLWSCQCSGSLRPQTALLLGPKFLADLHTSAAQEPDHSVALCLHSALSLLAWI